MYFSSPKSLIWMPSVGHLSNIFISCIHSPRRLLLLSRKNFGQGDAVDSYHLVLDSPHRSLGPTLSSTYAFDNYFIVFIDVIDRPLTGNVGSDLNIVLQ